MSRRKKRKKSIFKTFFKTILILIILLGGAAAAVIYFDPLGIKDISKQNFSISNENLYIPDEIVFDEDVVNIALIGVDKLRESAQRSDTIVILSFDTQTGRTVLTSIMRDLLVFIPERNRYDKINSAYSYGGEELLLKTINKNFDLNIKYYVTVDFSAMEALVDAVGGVEIDVKGKEIKYINETLIGGKKDEITKAGLQLLNGKQALAYSRIRKVGNSDWERTARQRQVISAIINRVKNEIDIKMLLSLTKNVAPMTNTNVDTKTMMALFASYIKHRETFIMEDFRLPYDNYSSDKYYNGIYYLKPSTLKDNTELLHKYIYGIDSFAPSGTVKQISNDIKYNH